MTNKDSESPKPVGKPKLIVMCQCGARAQKILDTPHQYICTRCGDTFEYVIGKK